jgi:shikimate dehydrogenase
VSGGPAVRRLAVLGHPVAHSRSPAMQNAALAELGLAGEWSYEAIDVRPERFAERVRAMAGEGFVGANVTVPHKLAARALADRTSTSAAEIGAANTLSFREGRIAADNTDGAGLIAALGEAPCGRRALVLGAGGAARAAVWALAREGAAVEVWNRTPGRAEALASDLGAAVFDRGGGRGHELIVNATTVGLARAGGERGPGLDALPIDAEAIAHARVVVDLVYGAAETELARLARARGTRLVDGVEVLVQQGAASLRLWTGAEPPIETMRRAARAAEPR